MSRRARSNLDRAYEACTALTESEMALLQAYLVGWRTGKGLPPVQAAPPRKRAPKAKEVAAP